MLPTFTHLRACVFLLAASIAQAADPKVEVVTGPSKAMTEPLYLPNRAPLHASPFIKLPLTAIKPGGWLKKSLELQGAGLAGHLGEISIWLTKKDNAWLNKSGKGQYGWEELPYWLKGYVRMAYLLGDKKMIAEANVWIDGTLASQRDNGDFGPMVDRGGKRDLWAQMLMLNTLQSHYEATGDKRVVELMTQYFAWQLSIPDDQFLQDYWENSRGGDNLASVYWLYNITGEKFLLELAIKIDKNTANWRQAAKGKLPNWHGVNVAQCFREPATYALQSGKPEDLKAAYDNQELMRDLYGQVPGGLFGADENARNGLGDPRQAAETCAMVEQMQSDEMMLRYTADSLWAENLEDVAFNTYSASFTPDYKALRYLTAPNQIVSDKANHAPGIQNEGPFLMMNPFSSRCCQHNHSSGWPNYAEATWMATPDNGLAAQLYCETEVKAKVGDGTEVTIAETTKYPFEEAVTFTISTPKAVDFPLYLRIPTWAAGATVKINGEAASVVAEPGKYVRLSRRWNTGDTVLLTLPMKIAVKTWSKNKDSVSVNYGPLTYALRIDEKVVQESSTKTAIGDSKWQPTADASKWPSYEIFAVSPWNYGLVYDADDPAGSFEIVKKPWPADNNPFTNANAPIEFKASGKLIPAWTVDKHGLCDVLPQSPVTTDQPATPITLVPMGGARLRISAFPVVK